ncbi:MAG: hypothetical protein AMJ43_03125 [Coxiella sp. DG_40]|nr:MAG: hypothetical protein AMJ43_03125 [Coxiella sp. DG_40]
MNLSQSVNIKIIFDSEAVSSEYKTGWGFSCFINNHILFDTGSDGQAILDNLGLMGNKIQQIDKIIISHEHNDHAGGLWKILESKKNLPVYICPGFSPGFESQITNLGSKPIESQEFQEIDENVFTTGEIKGLYRSFNIPEQSLIIRTSKGLIVITGCAHPGVIRILKVVKEHFPDDDFYLVLGGFHLVGMNRKEMEKVVSDFEALQIQKIAPLHCSGELAKSTSGKLSKNFIRLLVGQQLDL